MIAAIGARDDEASRINERIEAEEEEWTLLPHKELFEISGAEEAARYPVHETLLESLQVLGRQLVGRVGNAIGSEAGDLLCSLLDRTELDKGVCSSSYLSIVHYPPMRSLPEPAHRHQHQSNSLRHEDDMEIDFPDPRPPPLPLREAPHVDATILTLVWAPGNIGLQVRRSDTDPWEDMNGENGSNVVVMAGAVLQHATGGAVQAALQRVAALPSSSVCNDVGMVVFRLRANPRCVVDPLAFCRVIAANMPDLALQARRSSLLRVGLWRPPGPWEWGSVERVMSSGHAELNDRRNERKCSTRSKVGAHQTISAMTATMVIPKGRYRGRGNDEQA